MNAFILELYASQERLGKEFEDVLFDNLWNLYARSSDKDHGNRAGGDASSLLGDINNG